MAPDRTRYTFFIDPDLREALAAIKERDGIPESEQIRRAVRAWLQSKGVAADTPAKARGSRRTASKRAGR